MTALKANKANINDLTNLRCYGHYEQLHASKITTVHSTV